MNYASTGATGAGTLAATGLATGSAILIAVGIIFAGVAFFMLVRKTGSDRP